MKNRLDELEQLADQIDQQVKILSHSQTSVYTQIAEEIQKTYGTKIREQVDQAYAVGTEMNHDPESATIKKVKISVEPSNHPEDGEKRVDIEQEIRKEIYNKFPRLKDLRPKILIRADWNVANNE